MSKQDEQYIPRPFCICGRRLPDHAITCRAIAGAMFLAEKFPNGIDFWLQWILDGLDSMAEDDGQLLMYGAGQAVVICDAEADAVTDQCPEKWGRLR